MATSFSFTKVKKLTRSTDFFSRGVEYKHLSYEKTPYSCALRVRHKITLVKSTKKRSYPALEKIVYYSMYGRHNVRKTHIDIDIIQSISKQF